MIILKMPTKTKNESDEHKTREKRERNEIKDNFSQISTPCSLIYLYKTN